ncbi:hypothetical protein ACQ4PT_003175 [Festuca glaucescens]
MRESVRPRPSSTRSVPIPIPVTGPDSGQERKAAAVQKKRAPSAEEAAAKVQAAARGLLARRMMREVRAVEREAEAVAARVAAEAEALRADTRRRIGVGEELMRLVLRLDAVRGVREYRKKVTKKVLALQDAVDALEAKPAQEVPLVTDPPAAADAESLAADTVEMSEAHDALESGMEPELQQSGEQGVQIGSDSFSVETATEMDMEVDGGRAEAADSASTESTVTESVTAGEQAAEAEGEWEMVTGDDAFDAQPKAPQQEAAGEETEEKKTEAATADGLDAKKVMEMVAALCERSAQQCALIGALAERVDTLERAVRRVEEADRRRRRIKKLEKEGKINGKAAKSFYSD